MIYSRLDSRSQRIYYSTDGDIDSLINISRLNTKNNNDVRHKDINSVDLPCLNHIKPKNYLSPKNRNKTWYIGSDYSEIYNFINQPHNHQIKQKDIKEKNTSKPNSFFQLLGGKHQEWNKFVLDISRYIEKNYPMMDGKDIVKLTYELKHNYEQNPFSINPHDYNDFSELCKAVYDYSLENENRAPGFLDHIMRYARLMANRNQPFPIDFFNLSYTQFMYHMKWYKDTYYNRITGKNYYGLKHRLTTIQEFLIAYGINPNSWRYTLPSVPKRNFVYIPSPEIVHKIINYNFYPNNPDRTLNLQYIHAHNFWLGVRAPTELCLINKDKINFDEGYMEIIEQKKHYSIRTIYPEYPILYGKTRKSIKNYIDHVRPKFETSNSPNNLYLTIEGKAFTPRYLGMELSKTGKMICNKYHPYTARHWCASARLIRSWLNTKKYPDPLNYVQGFLGHDEQATTEGYICQARELFRKYPFDWINSTLKFDSKYIKEESALKSKQG